MDRADSATGGPSPVVEASRAGRMLVPERETPRFSENSDPARFCQTCCEPLLADPATPREIRKVVTVLFMDLGRGMLRGG